MSKHQTDMSEAEYQARFDDGGPPPLGLDAGAPERIVQITTGLYRTAQGVTSHTLYCLSSRGRMWKMTKDGWTQLDQPAQVEEDPTW